MSDRVITDSKNFKRTKKSEPATLKTNKTAGFKLDSKKRVIIFTAISEQNTSNMSMTITCQSQQYKNTVPKSQEIEQFKTPSKRKPRKRSYPSDTPTPQREAKPARRQLALH